MTTRGGRENSAPWRSSFVATTLVALAACSHAPPPVVSPPSSNVLKLRELQHTLDTLLASPDLARSTWGVVARSMTQDDTLLSLNPHRLLMPASSAKVITLAAAGDLLGWDFRYQTTVMTRGTVIEGALDGDLVIVGSGDPTFDDWDGAAGVRFEAWANTLRNVGIRRIRGRVIGDDNVFDDEGLGAGWAWDDVFASYSAAVSGLQFNQGSAQIVVSAADTGDGPPTIAVRPPSAALQIRNSARSGATADPPLLVRAVPRSTTIEVTGTVARGSAPAVRNVSVPNPTLYFAVAAREALIRAGIEIDGDAVDIDEVATSPDSRPSVQIANESSTPLAEFGRTMMLLSQNLFAETLLKTMGRRHNGVGSTESGRTAVRERLTAWGIDASEISLVDGSGLSRYNVVSPDAMVGVLAHVFHDERLRGPFTATLPLAGVDDRLSARLRDTAAADNVRAKSGSFSNARTLAGFVNTADGEPIAFAILANNYNARTDVIDRATETILAALAGFSRR